MNYEIGDTMDLFVMNYKAGFNSANSGFILAGAESLALSAALALTAACLF
jgi:hypothetical protein